MEFDVKWFAERINESATGKLIVGTGLVNKYRKIFADYDSSNDIIRNNIIETCRNADVGL